MKTLKKVGMYRQTVRSCKIEQVAEIDSRLVVRRVNDQLDAIRLTVDQVIEVVIAVTVVRV